MIKKIFPFLCLILSLSACDDEEMDIIYRVPDEVQPFVDQFLVEARNRGQDLKIDNLIVELTSPVENAGQSVCGVTYGEVVNLPQNLIQIDTQCLAWRHSEVSKEALIFHELGHAILFRQHRTDRLPNFDFASIMVSANWNIDDFHVFDLTKRDYYIDELFDASTPVPDWAE